MLLRPICADHQREYKVKECGIAVVELVGREGKKVPYALYFGDLWECPVCGHRIVGGYGERVVGQEDQEKLQRKMDEYAALGKLQLEG